MTGFNLARFHEAQASHHAEAMAELAAGRKRSHWIWFIFPQVRGLGSSETSRFYGIAGLDEARAFLDDPVLASRLRDGVSAMLALEPHVSASGVLGELDAMKFRSCLTLFAAAAPAEPLFIAALERFFGGEPDARTLVLLQRSG